MHVDPTETLLVPALDPVPVRVDLLAHPSARSQSHVGAGGAGGRAAGHLGRRCDARRRTRRAGRRECSEHLAIGTAQPHLGRRRRIGEPPRLRFEADELQPAEALLAGHLALNRVSHAERHGHELADETVAGVDPVKPRLIGNDHVVLRALATGDEPLMPRLARQRIDLADGDLDRGRLPVGTGEAQPHRLTLVHREEHAAVLAPALGDSLAVVRDASDRERPETWWQRVLATIIRDAEGPHEPDREPLPDRDLVVPDCDSNAIVHQDIPFVVS